MDLAQESKASTAEGNKGSHLRTGSAWRPAAILGCLIVGLFLLIVTRPLVMNHDAAALLQMSKMLLEGAVAYVDFNCFNPPLIIYLGVIPSFLARLLSVHIIPAFLMVVLLVAVWSTLTIWYLQKRARPSSGWIESALVPALYLGLTFLYRVPASGGDFGQREHLFVLLYMPFFFFRHARWEGLPLNRWMAVTVGLAAAVGASLKPFFVLTALVCEVYWFLSKRNIGRFLTPDFISFTVAGLSYAAHFLLLPGAVFDALFRRWIPFVMAGYGAYNQSYLILVLVPNFLLACLVAILLALVCPARDTIASRALPALAVFTSSSIFVYLYQHKLWDYQLMPAVFGALLILAISVDEFRRFPATTIDGWLKQRQWVFTQTMAILLFLAALFLHPGSKISMQTRYGLAAAILSLTLYSTFAHIRNSLSGTGQLVRGAHRIVSTGLYTFLAIMIVALGATPVPQGDQSSATLAGMIQIHSREGDAVAFMATRTDASYPTLLQLNRKPGSRYFDFLPVSIIYRDVSVDASGQFPYREGAQITGDEDLFLTELVSDLGASKPALIFIDSACQGCRRGFVLKDYVFAVGRLREIFMHYDALGLVDGFTVLKRRAATATGAMGGDISGDGK